ncbi:MAG TPA: class I SAM-dependent methyltransferase [Thermoplasmata archaeon]|nr:class I SAM-dependent methyltransferase [Thermoplasmata archaeon]
MSSARRRVLSPTPSDGASRRQAKFWNAQYRSDSTFFGDEASPFLHWVLSALRDRHVGPVWVELGSGYGRDLAELRSKGYSVRGVDVSEVGTSLARQAGLDVVHGQAVRFLSGLRPRSVDVVFSNLFLNMEFTREDHEQIFSLVRRALVPGGFHAYSVRSVSDRWYGRGERVGPHTFDFSPDGPVLHFFSQAYARSLRRGRFRCLRSWEGPEAGGGFPIRVLYILERKPASGTG